MDQFRGTCISTRIRKFDARNLSKRFQTFHLFKGTNKRFWNDRSGTVERGTRRGPGPAGKNDFDGYGKEESKMRRQTHTVCSSIQILSGRWLEIEAALSSGCYPNRAVLNPGKYSRNSKALLRIRQPDSNIATAHVLLIALSFIHTPINYRSTV